MHPDWAAIQVGVQLLGKYMIFPVLEVGISSLKRSFTLNRPSSVYMCGKIYATCAGKMSCNEQIFKNELLLFSHSQLKNIQNDV